MIELLQKTSDRAKELLDQYGLTEQGWTFEFSRHKTLLGQCNYSEKKIHFSLYYLEHSPWEQVEDTLLHEVAHALTPKDPGHGYEWRLKAMELGAKPETCAEQGTYVNSAQYNYVIKCGACGKEVAKKYRLRPALIQRYRSRCCHASLVPYRYVRS